MLPLQRINKLRYQGSEKIKGFLERKANELVKIYSKEWGKYWKSAGSYTSNQEEAWVLTFDEAFRLTCHCGPEKQIFYEFIKTEAVKYTTKYQGYFYFATLKYCDIVQDEKINIGVIVCFEETGNWHFIYPENLARLKHCFKLEDSTVLWLKESFLQQFAKIAKGMSRKATTRLEFEYFVHKYFYAQNDSCLQFLGHNCSASYSMEDKELEDLRTRYLSNFN